MNLTPSDVEDKAFTQALRGYQMDEVDDFLDEVVATLRTHEQRLRESQDRIRSLESDMSSRGGDESTISRAFLAAQRSADALIAEAEKEAAKITKDAEAEASRLVEDRDLQRKSLLDEINGMRAAVAALKGRLSDLASSVSSEVAGMESALRDAEAEVREPVATSSEDESEEPAQDESAVDETQEQEDSAPMKSVQSIIDELPTLDLTEESPTRVSARPWERG